MPRVLQPETAALLDQVSTTRNALPRLMRLHRERMGGLRKLDAGSAEVAVDEPLQRDLAGPLVRASLANLNEYDYVAIGRVIRRLAEEYHCEFESEESSMASSPALTQ